MKLIGLGGGVRMSLLKLSQVRTPAQMSLKWVPCGSDLSMEQGLITSVMGIGMVPESSLLVSGEGRDKGIMLETCLLISGRCTASEVTML